MKLVACMNVYAENNARLVRCINDVADLGATHVLICDGAYELFPNAMAASLTGGLVSLQYVAQKRGMGIIFYQPRTVYAGNEVEKRQLMLDLTLAVTTSDDWWLLWDGDFHLDSEPIDLKPVLTDFMHSGRQFSRWGDALLTDSKNDVGWYPVRLLYRAIPGMRLTTNHYIYRYPDGESTVMNNPQGEDLARGLMLPMKVRHSPERSDQLGRRQKQIEYYERRHALGIES